MSRSDRDDHEWPKIDRLAPQEAFETDQEREDSRKGETHCCVFPTHRLGCEEFHRYHYANGSSLFLGASGATIRRLFPPIAGLMHRYSHEIPIEKREIC